VALDVLNDQVVGIVEVADQFLVAIGWCKGAPRVQDQIIIGVVEVASLQVEHQLKWASTATTDHDRMLVPFEKFYSKDATTNNGVGGTLLVGVIAIYKPGVVFIPKGFPNEGN
jgi:hypothetical protein